MNESSRWRRATTWLREIFSAAIIASAGAACADHPPSPDRTQAHTTTWLR